MSKKLDSPIYTMKVAILLCAVCAVAVAASVVLLRPMQEENKVLDIRKSLLISAGLIKDFSASKSEVQTQYQQIKTIIVKLDDGTIATDIDPETFNQREAAKNPSMSKMIEPKSDLAGIKRRELYSKVYLVKGEQGYSQLVLPIYGKGLWSTMYGFLSLELDTKTVSGFAFYEHGETPGLGGEVDNPTWKAQWRGKVLMDEMYRPIIDVIKGRVSLDAPNASVQVDGISGATLTCNGVENLFHYWLGEDGFGPFLASVRQGVINEL